MIIACSWCGKILPEIQGNLTTLEGQLSHSICLTCMQKLDLFDEIDSSNSMTYGQAIIDENNIITSYETKDHSVLMGYDSGVVGKDYFTDFNPTLSVKSLKYKLSGLRRRKNDGQLEMQYLIIDDSNIQFTSVEMTHFKTTGDTLIKFKLIQKEQIK